MAVFNTNARLFAGTRAVLFDIDDTLVDTASAFLLALKSISVEFLPIGTSPKELLSHWRQDPGHYYAAYERGEISYDTQRRLRAERIQSSFGGVALDDESFEQWNALFERAFVSNFMPIEGAFEMLAWLERAGLPYGALSNAGTGYQKRKLAAAGLADVPMLVGVDTLGFGKPDPRVFHEAVRRLSDLYSLDSLEAHEVVYVGDNPINDALASQRAGLRPIWFAPENACDLEPTGRTFPGSRVTTLIDVAQLVISGGAQA